MNEFIPTLSVAGILAVIAPLAAQALSRLTFKPQTKQLIAVGVSIVAALFAFVVSDGFNQIPGNDNPVIYFGTLVLVVIAISQLAFSLIWRPTGVADKIALATATKSEKAAIIDARQPASDVPDISDLPQHRAE